MKNMFKRIWPHIISVLFFIILSVVYFSPQLQNKTLNQSDRSHYLGMSKEIKDFRQETGEEALWTNSMFGGMPSFLISTYYKGTHIKIFHRILNFIKRPASFLFLLLIGSYFAFLLFGFNPWISMVGSIAYSFCTFTFMYMEAGHNSKVMAIGYLAPTLASLYAAYHGKLRLGAVLFGIFLALQISVNHPQITYYTAIGGLMLVIVEFVVNFKNKELKKFFIISFTLLIPVLLAIGSNFGRLWSVYEYGKHSMRGGSELEFENNKKQAGLDLEYATRYSYGVGETMTFLIPNFKGGSMSGELSTNSESYKFLRNNNVPAARAKEIIKQLPLYHGPQYASSAPIYLGAISIFLFVFALFAIKGPKKWWLLSMMILALMLGWGKHFMPLTELFMEHFPWYNKFRDVKMIYVLIDFGIPLMAIFALYKITYNKISDGEKLKYLKYSLYIVGGITLLFSVFPGIFSDFRGANDTQLPEWLQETIVKDRKRLLQVDAFRSLVFILLSAATIFAFIKKKIKKEYVLLIIGTLILIDLWTVNRRIIDEDDFIPERKAQNPFTSTPADQFIMNDPNHPNFRVLNLSVSTFNDAHTAYYHHSIGGYHGAKMQRYQELIEYHIQPEIQQFVRTVQDNPNNIKIDRALQNLEGLNMLNTKYIITNPNGRPVQNPHCLGKAWLVEDYRIVDNANEEIEALNDFDPQQTAIIDKQFEEHVQGRNYSYDSSATIELTHYEPNHLKYDYRASKPQLAVFSEVYYPHGWYAYIDGEEASHFRVNYILRAMNLPAGEHQIEFRFRPKSYYAGGTISGISSILLIAFFVLVIGYEIRKYFKVVSD